MPNRKILVSDVRVRGTGKTEIEEDPMLPTSNAPARPEKASRKENTVKLARSIGV